MKIELDYDPTTGNISDPNNTSYIHCFLGLEYLETKPASATTVAQLIELKTAGYSLSDIADMKKLGLL